MANTNLTGIYSVEDLLEVRNSSAAEFGQDKIFATLQADLTFYNEQVNEQLSVFAESLTEQMRTWGGSVMHRGTKIDQFGVAPGKKGYVSSNVSFPIYDWSYSVGWTNKYLQKASPAELMSEYLAIRQGHSYDMTQEIKRAIFNNTNYTFVDKNNNGVSLTIKRLLNADGDSIPDYQGTAFTASTHTHYVARVSTLANSDVDSLVSNVTEHGFTTGLIIAINIAQKSTISALGGFTALGSALIAYNSTDTTKLTLDNSDLNNQMIGLWNDSIFIWVKPWVPANYILCMSTDADKVLGFRQEKNPALRGLRLAASMPNYPLMAETYESTYGFGVNARSSAAVLYIGGTTWANPTIS